MPLTDSEINALVVLLADKDPEILSHVEQQLMSIGTEGLDKLKLAWENSIDPEVQVRLETIMQRLQLDKLKVELKNWMDHESHDLLKGLWLVSRYKFPDLSYQKLQADLNTLVAEVRTDFELSEDSIVNVKNLNHHFFKKIGFKPNTADFHSPNNSMINQVLLNRRGNPISLCSVYMLLGKQLGVPLEGVNMPNLFILLYKTENRTIYINVFNRGIIFTKGDIETYIKRLNLTPQPLFFEACSAKDIVLRSLRNLVLSYQKTQEEEKIQDIRTLIDVLMPEV